MNLKIQFSQMQWGRVLLIGVLVVLLVIILNLVLPVLANHVCRVKRIKLKLPFSFLPGAYIFCFSC